LALLLVGIGCERVEPYRLPPTTNSIPPLFTQPGEPDPVAVARLLLHPDPAVRAATSNVLWRLRAPLPVRLQQEMNAAPDQPTRLDIARWLGRLGDTNCVGPLLASLEPKRRVPPSPAIRAAVIEALTTMGAPAIPALCHAAIDEELDPATERVAAEVLTRLGPAATQPIADALARWRVFPDPAELQMWVGVLRALGYTNSLPALDPVVEPATARAPDIGPPVGLLTPRDRAARALPADGVVRLTLHDALRRPGGRHADLDLELTRRGGAWDTTAYGYAPWFNDRNHDASVTVTGTTLHATVMVGDDNWVRGGVGDYAIEVSAGTYRGAFNAQPVSGAVTTSAWAHTWPPTPPVIAAGEHPRLLFRRHDLPALRARAATPFGRAVLRALQARLAADKKLYAVPVNEVTNWESGMDHAIGHGFLAVLFNDAMHGARGRALFTDRTVVMPYLGEHGERWPAPLSIFPLAYDLLYDHLTPAVRDDVSARMAAGQHLLSLELGPLHVFSAGSPPGLEGVPGLSALAGLREKGPFRLPEPQPPTPVHELTAPPTADGPVNKWTTGTLLRNWDGLSAEAIVQREIVGKEHAVIALPASMKGRLVSVIATDHPVAGKLEFGLPMTPPPVITINGRRLDDGALVILQPGRHQVVVETTAAFVRPTFAEADAFYAQALHRRHAWLKQRWLAAKAAHARDGEYAEAPLVLAECRRTEREWFRVHEGHGGTLEWLFLHGCRMTLGEGFAPDTPLPAEADAGWIASHGDRALCVLLGAAPASWRARVAEEFDRRGNLGRLSCTDLILAFVNYPLAP
jgi:hypothetical protein